MSVEEFLVQCRDKVLAILKRKMEQLGPVKVSVELFGHYVQPVKNLEATKSFNTKSTPVSGLEELEELVERLEAVVKTKASEFEHNDSGMLRFLVSTHSSI